MRNVSRTTKDGWDLLHTWAKEQADGDGDGERNHWPLWGVFNKTGLEREKMCSLQGNSRKERNTKNAN